MGVSTYQVEATSTVSPCRLFKALVLDHTTLIPKLVPQAFESIVTLEGDGGPGTIKQINFAEGSEVKYLKERVDVLDKENFSYAYTIIDGDALNAISTLEKITNEIKFEASSNGGSIVKSTATYYTTGDNEVKEEEMKAGSEKTVGLFKAIEAYLLANPDA